MANTAEKTMTVEEFFLWCRDQEERYELVDGIPVPLRGLAGASMTHDVITANLIAYLRDKLRGSGCRPTTPDAGVRTAIKKVRRPDVTIECSPPAADSYEARSPIAVFEVLSPTTRKNDRNVKLQEYMRHPSLQTIVHIDPDLMDVLVYRRTGDGTWDIDRLDTAEAVVNLSGTSAVMPLSSIYEDVPLPPSAPRTLPAV